MIPRRSSHRPIHSSATHPNFPSILTSAHFHRPHHQGFTARGSQPRAPTHTYPRSSRRPLESYVRALISITKVSLTASPLSSTDFPAEKSLLTCLPRFATAETRAVARETDSASFHCLGLGSLTHCVCAQGRSARPLLLLFSSPECSQVLQLPLRRWSSEFTSSISLMHTYVPHTYWSSDSSAQSWSAHGSWALSSDLVRFISPHSSDA